MSRLRDLVAGLRESALVGLGFGLGFVAAQVLASALVRTIALVTFLIGAR